MSETLEIVAGKFYRTRDGRKAFVVGKLDAAICVSHPWVVRINAGYCHYRPDGSYTNVLSDADLIAEWRDTPTPLEVLKEYTTEPSLAFHASFLDRAKQAIAAHSQGATP